MDDEFKLCWKNFQDNIASGFQNLYDRGDLVDVTLACDGKLLHAHKIVLAICSPYFQEIFITNPCKHPIIILKDVTFNIMCELLEFMYQGVVNVKHTELQSFMKIGQLLQIKGLATNSSSSAASTSSEKSTSQTHNPEEVANACNDAVSNTNVKSSSAEANSTENSNSGKPASNINAASNVRSLSSPASSPTPMAFSAALNQQNYKNSGDANVQLHHPYHAGGTGLKRHSDFNTDALSIYHRKQFRRSVPPSDHSDHTDGVEAAMDQVNAEDFFLQSMMESRYDLNNIKREGDQHGPTTSGASLRNSFGPAPFGFDYNLYKNSSGASSVPEYPNDLHMPSDYSKNFGNHMDIPPIAPGEHWMQGKLEFMLSQRGKPLLVHAGHTFGIQYVRKDKKYWQCNLSRKFNCKARVTTTDTGEIIVTNNEHCHTEIRQHLRKDYQRNKVMMNALINLSTNRLAENLRRHNVNNLNNMGLPSAMVAHADLGTPLSAHGEPCILDLGKMTGSNIEQPSSHKPHDDDVPLDCGIRSLTAEETTQKSCNVVNDNSHNDGSWKCKNESVDTQ